ncbi:MAG: phage integrase N-terminal SAM-like domain-containing protein [Beggiatoa sp.]|nr:phage integrase N-terminal SAM-like domain-containing protein [Beggiatoa sp.]
MNQVRDRIRRNHYSIKTEEAYLEWIRRFVYQTARRPA